MVSALIFRPRIVAIVGPTASGKTALAMQTARKLSGEIVSCDSVQVYRGLDIGSGKASLADRAEIPHHLVDIFGLDEEMNAGIFATRAARAIDDILGRDRLPIVTGGTGLYLTALLKGLFDQGGTDLVLRSRLDEIAVRRGSARLHRFLASKDPEYAARTKSEDRVRIVRALEVCLSMGRPFSQVQRERQPVFRGETLTVGLEIDRAELRDRVTRRVKGMLAEGLIEETRRALSGVKSGAPTPRALGAIGYREVVERLAQGPLPAGGDEELLRAIVISSMQYAKRQMTYFRNQFAVEWFGTHDAALRRIEQWVGDKNNRGV
ncbi:MAG: tRNA (adenosine(37)-N6)-dimethylallyltransferase MiaA [Vicinamibacteria bacterium]